MASDSLFSHVSKITIGNEIPDGVVHQGWLENPLLIGGCRELYLQEIRAGLQSGYRDKLSCIYPIVENVVKLNITKDHFVVGPEMAAFQKVDDTLDDSPGPKYIPRDIVDVEDILVTEVDRYMPKNIQMFQNNGLIVVSGAGGQGKTTQMLKLAVDWSSEQSNPILTGYELLFYIPLPRNTSAENIETLICDEIRMLPGELKHKLKFVLENRTPNRKHLFIIDGFETVGNNTVVRYLIDGCAHVDATVIVCGRPYWMKDFKSSRSPDLTVDIKGISETNMEQLCLNVLGGDQENVNQLMDICTKYIMDTSLMRIPLFTILCCYIFHATKALELDVCNHARPTSITELFNAILRLLLKMYSKRMGKEYPVSFNRSPFDESGINIPGGILRLLYQISKMSFYGIKQKKESFSAQDLQEFFIEPDELCHLGIMICTSDTMYGCERYDADFSFKFKHKMFQEYMAGLYMSKESSVIEDIIDTTLSGDRKVSGDDGYCSEHEDPIPPEKPKTKKKKHTFAFLKWPRKKSEYVLQSQESNLSAKKEKIIPQYRSKASCGKVAEENVCPDSSTFHLDLQLHCQGSSLNLEVPETSSNSSSAVSDILPGTLSTELSPLSYRSLPNPVTRKCLFNLLNPFQNAVLFACGAKPEFTRNLLDRCNPLTLAKVCKWNSNKFDVGYESALFSESQDPTLAHSFYKFFRSKETQDRVPTSIQFPSPNDEYTTGVLASSISEDDAKNLLYHWYNVDLQTYPLAGANIVHSDSVMLELNDPCLFEMLLLHKFCHRGVMSLKVTGNYFPGFPELSVAFPDVTDLFFDGVNIPSLPRNYNGGDRELTFVSLEHLKLVNVHASFPFCKDLLKLLTDSKYLKTLVLQKIDCDSRKMEILSQIKELTGLQELSLVKMNLCFEDFVHSTNEPEPMVTVTDIIRELTCLSSLNLGYNNIGIAITGLVHALKEHQLSELFIRKCRIPKFSFENIAPMFQHFRQLKHLDISLNTVSEKLESLLFWLQKCPNLQALDMRECSLSPENFQAAAKAMQGMKQLVRLDISHNNLSSAAGPFVVKLPTTVKELLLANCNILSMDAVALAPIIRKIPNLECLDLQDNPIYGGVEPILLALKNCKPLKMLNLRNCRLMPCHFLVIADLLPCYYNLQVLTIGRNTCCDDTRDARSELVKSLLKCKQLQCLICCVLFEHPLGRSQVEQLENYLKEVKIYRCATEA